MNLLYLSLVNFDDEKNHGVKKKLRVKLKLLEKNSLLAI